MKGLQIKIYILLSFLIGFTSFAFSSEREVYPTDALHTHKSVVITKAAFHLSENQQLLYTSLSEERSKVHFTSHLSKKSKYLFLIQNLNNNLGLRKLPYTCRQESPEEGDEHKMHRPYYNSNYLIRPAYYTFLFRLSPF
jgi:hypothetical protein